MNLKLLAKIQADRIKKEPLIHSRNKDNNPRQLTIAGSHGILIHFDKKRFIQDNMEMECSICQEEFQEGSKDVMKIKCKHLFHKQCIDAWFTKHSTCPLCRDD